MANLSINRYERSLWIICANGGFGEWGRGERGDTEIGRWGDGEKELLTTKITKQKQPVNKAAGMGLENSMLY
jgi:hypothetical protein